MQKAHKNVTVLAACQALLMTNNVILIALNALAGYALADNKALATLPITTYVVGAALTTIPASLLMKQFGRQAGFMVGAGAGLVGALICSWGIYTANFWLLCFGTLVMGMYNAFGGYYRFAAADAASDSFKSRAISLVLAGGIVGGVLGPESSKWTRGLLPMDFLGSYLSLVVLSMAAMLLITLIDIPGLSESERNERGRPLRTIMAQPVFLVAALGAMIGYGIMNLLMTVTPLAMGHHHHPYSDAALVIEWHVIGMFAPSFFTGSLIQRFGVLNVMLTGVLLMFACVGIAVAGTALMNFWTALVLLGVGWNFLYVGGTTLLTESHSPAEKAKTQGANDFLVFVAMALSSITSGALLDQSGWQAMNYWALPFLAVVAAAIFWFKLQRSREPVTDLRG